jgi:hypothetical protein
MLRRIARATLIGLFAVVLSSCQMTVRMTTRLDARGGGTFTIAMSADKELRDQLTADASSGLEPVQGLFDGLRARGWTITQTEPSGGLSFAATKRFRSAMEFDRVLGDLRDGGNSPQLGGVKLTIGYETHRSFLRTVSNFHGNFDTSGLKLDPSIVREVRNLVRFEVRAELPGSVTVGDANGSASDRIVVWHPDLGSSLKFSADSSALRIGSLLLLLIPGIVSIVALGSLFRARYQRREDGDLAGVAPAFHGTVAVAQVQSPSDEEIARDGLPARILG